MKKTRHTEETIIQVLNEARAGGVVSEICRRHGISEATFYKGKQKYGGMQVSEEMDLEQKKKSNTINNTQGVINAASSIMSMIPH